MTLDARTLDAWTGTHGEVRSTDELRRVAALPWREELPAHAAGIVTRELGGDGMELRPKQAEILVAISEGGCFASVPVGGGKTLPTFLASHVAGVQKGLLLIPSKLRHKTRRDFAALAQHWPKTKPARVRFDDDTPPLDLRMEGPALNVAGYGMLSTRPELIEEISPQLIILDEAHACKNLRAGCTKRLVRYLRKKPTRVLAMSGTVTDRSLLDFWHLLVFTHGDGMPLPRSRAETAMWARAVDEKPEVRARPGALSLLLRPGEQLTPETARAAVGRRWRGTTGVVEQKTADVAASIQIERLRPQVPVGARPHLKRLEGDHIRPDGEEATPADVWRIRRELVTGFAYVWREQPPEHWRKARLNWGRFARAVLERGDARFDTELQVSNGCKNGDLPDRQWRQWREVRDDFRPISEPRWFGDDLLEYVVARCREPTLVWVEHVAFGERLADLTGWSYYRRKGGHDARGNFVEDDPADRPAILSVASCSDGLNLQHRWHQNLVVTPSPNGRTWEQMLGRTHRPGQQEDQIMCEVICTRLGVDLEQAIADAEYTQAMTGVPHKLLIADWV